MTILEAQKLTTQLKSFTDLISGCFTDNPKLRQRSGLTDVLITIRDKYLSDFFIHSDQDIAIDELINTDFSRISYKYILVMINDCFTDLISIADANISYAINFHCINRGISWDQLFNLSIHKEASMTDFPELPPQKKLILKNTLWNELKQKRVLA